MSRVCDSSYFQLIFWSNSNGRLDFPQLLSDLSILGFRRIPGSLFSLLSSWPFSFVVMKFSCGTLMFSRMKFNRSAARRANAKINKVQNLNKLQEFE